MSDTDATHVHFAGHVLDIAAQRLWRDGVPVQLRPAAWALLVELLRRPGALVSAQELADALWPGLAVTPKALTNRIAELREALGDDSTRQSLIQTVPRRGYRFVAEVKHQALAAGKGPSHPTGLAAVAPADDAAAAAPTPGLRAAELQHLHQVLVAATAGRRQAVLIGGEPGLGKTWMLDRFAASLPHGEVLLGRGQCIGQANERESFGPWLSLLADLCDGPQADTVVPLLRRCAPSWLLQLPWLQQADDAAAMRGDLVGTATGRMLREGCALLEAVARIRPLVLLLDDLHWADAASVDLLQALVQGRSPVPLLLVATWRPADARLHGHPLAALASTAAHGALPLHALSLRPLDKASCARLLETQAPDPVQAARLLPRVMRLAQGNPLVALTAMAQLRAEDGSPDALFQVPDAVAGSDDVPSVGLVPESLRAVVAARLAALSHDERALLQAASVIGARFTPSLVAAALQADAAPLAQLCVALAARQLFICGHPDAADPAQHAFIHDAYRQALYDSLPVPDRQRMHGRVARCVEQLTGGDTDRVAPLLAGAYVRAAMPSDAARWLERTAQLSLARFDHRAAVQALKAALQQLAWLPHIDDAVRQHQLRLHLSCGNLLNALRIGHAEAPASYAAADALACGVGDNHSRVRALLGLTFTLFLRGRLQQAVAVAADLVQLAESEQPSLAAAAHTYAGIAALGHGQFEAALRHCELALGLPHEPGVPMYVDLPSLSRLNLGMTLVEIGDTSAGLQHMAAALERSRTQALPHDLMQALYWVAEAHRIAGLALQARPLYQEALAHAERLGIEGFELAARFGLLACTDAAPGRSAAMARLLDRRVVLGEVWNAAGFLRTLAEVCLADGDIAGCRAAVTQGLALQGGDQGTRHLVALQAVARQLGLQATMAAPAQPA